MNLLPICGAAPLPGGAVWNSEPVLLSVLLVGGASIFAGASHDCRRLAWAMAGWAILTLALVSPICSISVALFSMRVTQHLVITLVAAPMLAIALQPHRGVCARLFAATGVGLPAAAFAGLLWLWHLPVPYGATFAPDGIAYWSMHVSLIFSATWLWAALLHATPRRPLAAAIGSLLTGIQMGVLGALLTFAPRAMFAVHRPEVTLPWGLTPLEDQQLGGLLMWVPGGLLLVAVLGAGFAGALRPAPREATARLALGFALLFAAAIPALAQGNDSTSAAQARQAPTGREVTVGVLTTTEVTTGSSGPSQPEPSVPDGADRRTRVLGPVCAGLDTPVLEQCRAKSGL